jgi:hypothetical protein
MARRGRGSEEFWERKMGQWRLEEQQLKVALDGLATADLGDRAFDAQRLLELAKFEHSILSSLAFSTESCETYRYPFDLIFKRAKSEKWSGRLDSN